MAGLSVANYVLAVVLVYVFAVKLGWLPAIYTNNTGTPAELIKSLTLPALAIGFPLFCFYTRLLRADILEQMQGEDYVVTAKAKGVGPWRVLVRHALPNSLFGLLTIVALNLGTLIGATVIIEQIFAVPGIGHSLLEAINNRDVPVVEGIVLVLAVVVVRREPVRRRALRRAGPEDQVWALSSLRPKPAAPPRRSPSPPTVAEPVGPARLDAQRSTSSIPSALIGLLLFLCFVWPLVRDRAPADRRQHPRRQPPVRSPPGTRSAPTQVGNDLLVAAALRRAQASLEIAFAVNVIGLVVGGPARARSPRYWGSFTDTVIMRVLDVLIAFPSLVLALAIAQSLGPEQAAHDLRAVRSSACRPSPGLARAQTLRLRERPFMLAARLAGTRAPRILLRHIAPNILPALVTFGAARRGRDRSSSRAR